MKIKLKTHEPQLSFFFLSLALALYPLASASCSPECPLFFGKCPSFFGKCPLFSGKCPLFFGKCPLFSRETKTKREEMETEMHLRADGCNK